MTYKVEKKYYFEAAHRLGCGYQGKCTNNHGHSFQVTISLVSETLDDLGMVVDFAEMALVKNWIDVNLDHATILMKGDPFLDYLKREGHKVYETDMNPTSECIATVIFHQCRHLFETDRIAVKSVRVSETCTAAAEITG